MDAAFQSLVLKMPDLLGKLLGCPPHRFGEGVPQNMPERGVYLFSASGSHLYVGRTNRLRHRHKEHCSGKHNDAPFAFKLARILADQPRVKGGPTRAALQQNPKFSDAFERTKAQVRIMEFRWVEVIDANTQCLFEIYATLALGAKHNSFENH